MQMKEKTNFTLDKQLAELPTTIQFCKKCVISNQRPRIVFDEEGVCAACRYAEEKEQIDWEAREKELVHLLDQYRSKTGDYDVIVPASGGKDSAIVAHRLKHEYGMKPLTVTWAPCLYTDIGRENFDAFCASGFDNIMCTPNGEIHRKLARMCFELVGDPFHVFVMGQIAFPYRIALQTGIKLVFWGENGNAEYAGLASLKNEPGMPMERYSATELKGVTPEDFARWGISDEDIYLYKIPDVDKLIERGITNRWWGYYHKWNPQWNYYYAVENTGFKANPERSQGTFSKYASLDDKLDGIHHYMGFIKFGFGRATQDAAQEMRCGHLQREEAVRLVQRYDHEFPSKYFQEAIDYMGITEDEFHDITNRYRRETVWEQVGPNGWKLRQQVE